MFEYGIILTGGIAMGKSTAGWILKQWGYEVLEADLLAHQALIELKGDIISAFGTGILENQEISRRLLGERIFHNLDERKKLESLTHPWIFAQITQRSQQLDALKKLFFLDIPLYFETGARYEAREVWCIACDLALQKERLKKRSNLNEEQIQARLKAQLPIDQKKSRSHRVIENNSDLEGLKKQLKHCLSEAEAKLPKP